MTNKNCMRKTETVPAAQAAYPTPSPAVPGWEMSGSGREMWGSPMSWSGVRAYRPLLMTPARYHRALQRDTVLMICIKLIWRAQTIIKALTPATVFPGVNGQSAGKIMAQNRARKYIKPERFGGEIRLMAGADGVGNRAGGCRDRSVTDTESWQAAVFPSFAPNQ